MTVVAYSSKHRILAADSRCSSTALDKHVTDMQKVFRLKNGALLGIAGEADVRDLCALLARTTPRKLPTRAQLADLKNEHEALLVFPNGQVFGIEVNFDKHQGWKGEVVAIRDRLVAIGCGNAFAYGAMEAGANPIEAVRAACKRDLFCALPVQWERLAERPGASRKEAV